MSALEESGLTQSALDLQPSATTAPSGSTSGWGVTADGWAWWFVVPLAFVGIILMLRVVRSELAALPPQRQRLIAGLRAGSVGLLIVFLLEPACSRIRTESMPPTMIVMMDRSVSMAVHDIHGPASERLDEAETLGLVPAGIRPVPAREAARAVSKAASVIPRLSAALVALPTDPSHSAIRASSTGDLASLTTAVVLQLRSIAPKLIGMDNLDTVVLSLAQAFEEANARLSLGRADSVVDPATANASVPNREACVAALVRQREVISDLSARLQRTQAGSDAALVAGAAADAPLSQGLLALDTMSRSERALALWRKVLLPVVDTNVRIKVVSLERKPAPLNVSGDETLELNGDTDIEGALGAVSAGEAGENLAGVVIISDGRATAGGDAIGPARALFARGVAVAGVVVGSSTPPPDAVIGGILTASEVFRGETIRLDVRWRVTGDPAQPWNMIVTQNGQEFARREVRATNRWEVARFEVPADQPGLASFQARIERGALASSKATGVPGAPGLLLETWTGIPGGNVDDLTRSAAFAGAANHQEVIPTPKVGSLGDSYGSRITGWIIPPVTGTYVFFVAGDDQTHVYLATDGGTGRGTLIAQVIQWTNDEEWGKEPAQRSAPITLSAGKPCRLEILHKQGEGGDHLTVGWQLPDGTIQRPIPTTCVVPEVVAPVANNKLLTDYAEASLDNNQAQVVVAVNEDPLRVLLLDQGPRWDSRYLSALFDRDRRVALDRRYRQVRLPRGDTELLPPTQDELDRYDVVVLGDLAASELPPEAQARLTSFVGNRGGFLILLAGPRAMPADYTLGGLADVLPVAPALTVADPSTAIARSGHVLRLTRAGEESPVTAILDDPSLNRRLWPALAPLQWVADGLRAKVKAQVLVETAGGQPVVVVDRYGAGRVLYLGTDEGWRWRDRLGDRVHQTFWLQALRWGLGSRLRGADPQLQAAVDRSLIDVGEGVEVRGRARLANGSPAVGPLVVTMEHLGENGEPLAGEALREQELAAVSDAPGLAVGQITSLTTGRWRLTVTSRNPELVGKREQREVQVRAHRGQETLELSSDLAALDRIAAAGGGSASGFADAARLVQSLTAKAVPKEEVRRQTYSLWSGPWALLLMVGLLVAEWTLRKRSGLP